MEFGFDDNMASKGKIAFARGILDGELGWTQDFVDAIYKCTACGGCQKYNKKCNEKYNKNLMRLNEEHNVMAGRIADYIDHPEAQPFQDHKTDKHLDRVIPLTDYDETENKFIETADLENQIEFMKFYPEQGSVIIAATDGLIDSLGTTGNEFENEKDILQAYSETVSQSTDPMDIARVIGRKADEKAGIDNITLVVLTNREGALEPHKQNKMRRRQKPMKKLS